MNDFPFKIGIMLEAIPLAISALDATKQQRQLTIS